MAKLITVSQNLLEELLPHKKPFSYQAQLLKLQEEAKKKKLGIWSL